MTSSSADIKIVVDAQTNRKSEFFDQMIDITAKTVLIWVLRSQPDLRKTLFKSLDPANRTFWKTSVLFEVESTNVNKSCEGQLSR